MTTALGVSADVDGNGVTPLVHRRIIGAFFQNKGIMDGLGVSGRSDLKYAVAAGVAVCSRGGSDGKTLAYWAGGTTGNVSAGDPSNPRIDVVWIRALNKPEYSADANNQVEVGVTEGTPAVSPVAPSIPTDATALRYMMMPAGATVTQSASPTRDVDYCLPYGSAGNRVAYYRISNNFTLSATTPTAYCKCKIMLPTDRRLQFRLLTNFCAAGSKGALDFSKYSELWVAFRIDGNEVGRRHYVVGYGSWADKPPVLEEASCGRGEHSVDVVMWRGNGGNAEFHAGILPGVVLTVTDLGPTE